MRVASEPPEYHFSGTQRGFFPSLFPRPMGRCVCVRTVGGAVLLWLGRGGSLYTDRFEGGKEVNG